MSKELEALDGIKKVLAKYISEKTGVSEEKHFEYLQYDTEIETITKALTPPTVDEVCEELNKWYSDVVDYVFIHGVDDFTYDEKNKRFYKRMLNSPHEMTICRIDTNGCMELREPLPPHLITLIGRFYEAQDV